MVGLKLLLVVLVAAPVGVAALVFWRRWWPRAGAGELLLGAGVTVPVVLIVEVAALGSVPRRVAERPLDWLVWVHAGACAGLLAWVWGNRRVLGAAVGRMARAWRGASAQPVVRALFVGVLAWHAAVMAYGAWNWSAVIDDLQYHLPQAVQVFQDRRLGTVTAAQEAWADGYPRGAALLWAWSMILSGTDAAIHPINGCFVVLMMLGAVVAARRLGCSRAWALLAAALVPTAPIVSYLTTITYTDLALGGLVAASAAAAMPERRGGWSVQSAVLCAAAAVIAMWVKFLVAPAIAMIVGYRAVMMVVERRRATGPSRRDAAVWMQLDIVFIAVLAAAVPYVKTWLVHGTPVYPLHLRIGSLTLIAGPMDPDDLGASVQMPWVMRFVRYWSDWLTEIGPDSPGAFGPLFTVLMAAPTAAVCISQLGRPWGRAAAPRGVVVLALLVLAVLVVPLYHWPRYGVWVLVPMSVCTAWVVQAIRDEGVRRGMCVTAVVLCAANAALFGRQVLREVSMQVGLAADAGVDLWTRHRNRALMDALPRLGRLEVPLATRAALRAVMKPGETAASAVHTVPVLLMDGDYSYRVEHRPAKAWPMFVERFDPTEDLSRGEAEAPAWLDGLKRDGVAAAIVYKGTAEDRALAGGGSGFERVYEQPAKDGPVIVIYRRAAGS